MYLTFPSALNILPMGIMQGRIDLLIELGMISARHGVLSNQKDKHRLIAILKFKDADACKNCMELSEAADWKREINRVERLESYVIDAELDV